MDAIGSDPNGTLLASASWSGYQGDWRNGTFSNSMGTITSTEFIDANGKIYTDWIPAIRLE